MGKILYKKGKEHGNWKGGQSRFKCLDCKKVLSCCYATRCLKCRGKFHVGKNNHTWKGGKPNCLDCGKTVSYASKKCSKCGAQKGEKSYMWIKNRSKLVKRQERNDSAYYAWRMEVWKRDNYKCKMLNTDCSGKIVAHHILGWSAFPELRYEVNNGITLCHFHHLRKRNDEMKLSPFFQELVISK